MTLAEVVARLGRHTVVEGVLLIGSASQEALKPASDLDLVVVLEEIPAPLDCCGITYIDHRLTDLIFVASERLGEILDLEAPVDGAAWLGRIIRWFQEGRILHDRAGRLKRVQTKVRADAWIEPQSGPGREAWRGVSYNLAQTRRLLESDDPVYRAAAELRMALFGASDLLFNYFEIRHLPWEGAKAAVRYLSAHDPEYLAHFRAFIAEGDRDRKLQRYEELAALTVAPFGEVWSGEITVLALNQEDHPGDAVEAALRLWDELLTS